MDAKLIEELRKQTPGCANRIHFNNAGCSLAPQVVLDSLIDYLTLEQSLGGYEAAEQQSAKITNYYQALARLFNCRTEEIAWVENSTRAWNIVFQSLNLQAGDKVITGQSEYASNFLAMLHMRKRQGIAIEVVDNCSDGTIDLNKLESAIDSNTRLIALTHAPSQQGVLQPAVAVGEIARRHAVIYLLDASQSAGQLPVDVKAIGCHMLTGSGRKFLRGPRGTGFLYVDSDCVNDLDPPSVDLQAAEWTGAESYTLRSDARRFENWECYVAGKIALGVAADYAMNLGLAAIQTQIAGLSVYLRSRLEAVADITVHDPVGQHTGIVTFSSRREEALTLQSRLRENGINSGIAKRANAMVDFSRRNLGNINRLSLHYYNTPGEIDRLIDVIGD